ncbi:hypothetical protein AVT43_gp04 [Polaribacter phage P12002L]|uniref:Uncharacterized protein n=2 Tax=Incheonvirus TaxID=2976977 RepID=A0A0F7IN77_9CAUD|nr:hypothetical protein AVT42_gp04 [Polaribacter phage P12002S]YP_009209664.1 hypothetical protein AVT43_gp04 [Polaribacter phage P12002L]AKG94178.1 hypothetical protein P12002L_0004 [Polaribacter phage P12002L]AKG94260.1 hypothetical protein P12002S_0004 [Polaribacter phage P12002S]
MKCSYLGFDCKGEDEFKDFYVDPKVIHGFSYVTELAYDKSTLVELFLPSGCFMTRYTDELHDYLLNCGRFL